MIVWAAIDAIVTPEAPYFYKAGSEGPDEAAALLARDGRSWLPVR